MGEKFFHPLEVSRGVDTDGFIIHSRDFNALAILQNPELL